MPVPLRSQPHRNTATKTPDTAPIEIRFRRHLDRQQHAAKLTTIRTSTATPPRRPPANDGVLKGELAGGRSSHVDGGAAGLLRDRLPAIGYGMRVRL